MRTGRILKCRHQEDATVSDMDQEQRSMRAYSAGGWYCKYQIKMVGYLGPYTSRLDSLMDHNPARYKEVHTHVHVSLY